MTITKEIEIDSSEFETVYLIEEIIDRLGAVGCLYTEESQKELEPYKKDMQVQLDGMLSFMRNPAWYIANIKK